MVYLELVDHQPAPTTLAPPRPRREEVEEPAAAEA
jgi:hypothetical protein